MKNGELSDFDEEDEDDDDDSDEDDDDDDDEDDDEDENEDEEEDDDGDDKLGDVVAVDKEGKWLEEKNQYDFGQTSGSKLLDS